MPIRHEPVPLGACTIVSMGHANGHAPSEACLMPNASNPSWHAFPKINWVPTSQLEVYPWLDHHTGNTNNNLLQ